MAEEETKLNSLCTRCKALEFDASLISRHGINFRGSRVVHSHGLEVLQASALEGCHLCSLMTSALNICQPLSLPIGYDDENLVSNSSTENEQVIVEYVPCYSPWDIAGGERLEIRCGDLWAPLYLESPQKTCCGEPSYKSDVAKNLLREHGVHYNDSWNRAIQPPHPLCPCGNGVWEPNLLRHGQISQSDADPSSPIVIAKIKAWIDTCDTNHCEPLQCSSTLRSGILPFRILDLGPSDGHSDISLSFGEERKEDYITLSYRWGDVESLNTTSVTLKDRLRGISEEDLPQTIRDAVTITRLLGKRFLWVDALCILQDSKLDWDAQSARLGDIYSNAWLNISADVAENSKAGFLSRQRRNPIQIRNCEHPSLVTGQKKIICPFVGGAGVAVNKSILTERGWVFPERLLSRRVLHFSSLEVTWECASMLVSERQPTSLNTLIDGNPWKKIRDAIGGLSRPYASSSHELRTIPLGSMRGERNILASSVKAHGPVSYLGAFNLKDCINRGETTTGDSHEPLGRSTDTLVDRDRLRKWVIRARIFEPWYKLVTEFSRRNFTVPSDNLPAISGLARRFGDPLPTRLGYVAGLWAEDLSCGLAWSIRRASATATATTGGYTMIQQKPDRLKGLLEYRAPSFSWASVDAPVEFYDNTFSYYSKPYEEPNVLEFGVNLAGSDPFGRVNGGWIRLLASVEAFTIFDKANPLMEFDFIFDQPQLEASDNLLSQVLLLYLGIDKWLQEIHLMLMPVNDEDDRCYRIGLLLSGVSKQDWQRNKSEIVIV